MRTDDNNNPTAFTVDVAREAALVLGTDYEIGERFPPVNGMQSPYYTAKLLGDPVAVTIRVIDKIGYKTRTGEERWTYICLPNFVWRDLTPDQKRDVVGYHYQWEGNNGALKALFPNYGKS